VTHDNDGASFAEKLDAAAAPARRMAAITAQIGLSLIAPDAGCDHLCAIYEPHPCDGWRAEGCVTEIPAAKFLGYQPPPVQVHTCRSCHEVPLRRS